VPTLVTRWAIARRSRCRHSVGQDELAGSAEPFGAPSEQTTTLWRPAEPKSSAACARATGGRVTTGSARFRSPGRVPWHTTSRTAPTWEQRRRPARTPSRGRSAPRASSRLASSSVRSVVGPIGDELNGAGRTSSGVVRSIRRRTSRTRTTRSRRPRSSEATCSWLPSSATLLRTVAGAELEDPDA
jgi:hypothetical protein